MVQKSIFETLKGYYKFEELELPYEQKDGRIFFLLSIGHLDEQLQQQIRNEESKELSEIVARKYIDSLNLGRTKGLYKTLIDWLEKEGPDGFEEWQKCNVPHLVNVEQGFWVFDECQKEPKCGNCGSYLILKKDEEQRFLKL